MSFGLLATVSETTILCVICLAALIGNVSLYIIVYKNKDLRTITNLYILNLAAADLMVSVVSIPFTVVTVITGRWLFGDTACVALGFFTILSFIASVMSLGMIAINRYFYIVKWNTYKNTFTKRKALLFAAAVWAVSISLASSPLFGWAEYRFIPGKSYCFVYWPSSVYFMYFMIAVCFFGPLSAMAFSYYNILTFTKALKRRIAISRNNLTPPPQYNQARTVFSHEPTTENNFDSEIHRDKGENPQINRQDVSKLVLESKSHNFQVTPEETKMTNTCLLVVALFVIFLGAICYNHVLWCVLFKPLASRAGYCIVVSRLSEQYVQSYSVWIAQFSFQTGFSKTVLEISPRTVQSYKGNNSRIECNCASWWSWSWD